MKRPSRFVQNAAVLTVTALILRTIGMFFRVWMSNRLGSEGMGLYQLVFSVYVLVATFATTGISTAVTRLIADELAVGSHRSVTVILRRSVLLTLGIALASAALVILCARPVSVYWIKDVRAEPSLRILALSLPFMGVSSCLKGYFIACRKAGAPSSAQIFEQLVRIGVVMLVIGRFAERGLAYACAAVLIGDTVSEAVSCGYMYVRYLIEKRQVGMKLGGRARPDYHVVRRILSISAPIIGGRYVTTGLRTAENLLVPEKLSVYSGSSSAALSQFGMLKGMAMPILFFPGSFLSAFATLLVPELSSAAASGNQSRIESSVNRTVSITLILSMLIGGLFFVFSDEVGYAIYGSGDVGFFIRVLAPLVPLMYLESVVDGMLKGLDQQFSSFKYNVIDSASRIVLILILVPKTGMYGFLAVMAFSNILTSLLCLHRLLSVTGVGFRLTDWLIRPLSCSAASCYAAKRLTACFAGLTNVSALILGICAASAVFCITMLLTGGRSSVTEALTGEVSGKERKSRRQEPLRGRE